MPSRLLILLVQQLFHTHGWIPVFFRQIRDLAAESLLFAHIVQFKLFLLNLMQVLPSSWLLTPTLPLKAFYKHACCCVHTPLPHASLYAFEDIQASLTVTFDTVDKLFTKSVFLVQSGDLQVFHFVESCRNPGWFTFKHWNLWTWTVHSRDGGWELSTSKAVKRKSHLDFWGEKSWKSPV